MPNRCDFWDRPGEGAVWLGSLAAYGEAPALPAALVRAAQEEDYRAEVRLLLAARADATLPEMGWPWPWQDSSLTDYAYAWDPERGLVVGCRFGHGWWEARREPQFYDHLAEQTFADMSARAVLTLGIRSGMQLFAPPWHERRET